MRDKHEVAKGKNCRFCKVVWSTKEDLHDHLVRDHGKTLHLCGDCGNNYANEKSLRTHKNKCPKRNQPQPQPQPQPRNEGDDLFAPDAREEAEDLGFDAVLEVKEEEADEDETTSETTSEVVEASFGSGRGVSSEDYDEDENDKEKASGEAAATFIVTPAHAASEEDDEDDDDGEEKNP